MFYYRKGIAYAYIRMRNTYVYFSFVSHIHLQVSCISRTYAYTRIREKYAAGGYCIFIKLFWTFIIYFFNSYWLYIGSSVSNISNHRFWRWKYLKMHNPNPHERFKNNGEIIVKNRRAFRLWLIVLEWKINFRFKCMKIKKAINTIFLVF